MRKAILAGSLALVFGIASACAHADTIYALTQSTCSSGCNVLPAGTVDLSQVTTNEVEVTVTLTNDYSFRQAPDTHHWAFAFDLSGVTGNVTASNITSGPTSQTFALQSPGSYSDAGLGSFTYVFKCTTCSSGATGTPTHTLSFLLTGTGLTEGSFVSNGSYFFGVDVVGLDQAAGVGLTGNIGAPGPGTPGDPTPVPEPSTLLFLGTGLTTLGGLVRARMAQARSRQ